MKLEKTNEEKEILFRMNQLRGVLALIVLLSHIWGYTGIIWLVPFNKIVTIAVGFFFFLSGYGMLRSFCYKKDYLKEIFKIKIPFLLWMALLAYIFSALFERIASSYIEGTNIYLPLGIKQFLLSTNWYVYELIGFYMLFAVSMRFLKEKYQLWVVGIVSVIAFVILFQTNLVEAYYNSIIGFWLGMFFGKYGCQNILKKYKHGYILGIVLLGASFLMMLMLNRETMVFAIIRNLAAAGAIILALYIVRFLNVNDCVMRYLSKISPEIYFYHMPIAVLCSKILKNSVLYGIVVIVASLGVAILINPLNNKIQEIIKGAKKNEAKSC